MNSAPAYHTASHDSVRIPRHTRAELFCFTTMYMYLMCAAVSEGSVLFRSLSIRRVNSSVQSWIHAITSSVFQLQALGMLF